MNDMFGYNGKIIYINLSSQSIEVKDLDSLIAEEHIGGAGLSAKLTYDLLTEQDYEALKSDPLASVNPLIFSTGPLTGTATPSSSRYCVTGISPLTGIWGESTSGGVFPVILRRCGYDAIIITGKAQEPTYLFINDTNVEFKSATGIWGKNTRETTELIRKELGDEKLRVACIGTAGENLVKYAGIINDEGRAAGRCGLGTIMGSKNLKALAVNGRQKIEYADRETLMKVGKETVKTIMNYFQSIFISHYGSLSYTDIGMVLGDIPAYYFTNTEFKAEYLTGRALKEKYPVLSYACVGCQIACGRTTFYEKDGRELEIDGPEYETMAAFGPLCGIFDFDPILEANHLCNLEGLDTISAGVVIAFLIYLVENNIGTQNIQNYLKDINISDLKWGNAGVFLKLIEKIIERNGIGDLLAEGVKIMAQKLEVDPELAAHVKGLEIPMHDPRAYLGQALTYMVSCVGASHKKGEFYGLDGELCSFRGIKKDDRFKIDGREKTVIGLQDIAAIFDSAVTCSYAGINIPIMTKLLKSATGYSSLGNRKKFMMAGERGTTLKRLISCKLGVTREDDTLPKIVTKALKSGATAGIELNLTENLKEYYKLRNWDWETGAPTKEKLEELGI
jgi:aldehyde:ferredoxin oxidoreductase